VDWQNGMGNSEYWYHIHLRPYNTNNNIQNQKPLLHNKPKAEVHLEYLLAGPKEEKKKLYDHIICKTKIVLKHMQVPPCIHDDVHKEIQK
jgi:hypothetical protein